MWDLRRDYRAAFLGCLVTGDETALARGHDLGRAAVAEGCSILDLAHVHHDVLLETLVDTPAADVQRTAAAAAQFFLEVLVPFEMTRLPWPAPDGPPAGGPVPRPPTGGH